MKATKLIIILIILIMLPAQAADKASSLSSLSKIKPKSELQKDTATVNRLIKDATKYLSSKKGSMDMVKTYIDSAVLICEEKNIEFPARLHLLLAEYHFSTGDLRSSSEEATLALKKSADEKNNELLARIYLFFGKYYSRTRSYKESLEYLGNAIALAKKEKIRGVIPTGYYGQALVYISIGDLKARRESFRMMIEAGFMEGDSSIVSRGYHLLGTTFCGDTITSDWRNFRKADSLLKKGIAISLIRKDTFFLANSMANIGWNYYLEKMYDSSIFSYEKSLKYSIQGRLFSISANSLGNLGLIYSDLNQHEKAIKYFQKGIQQANKENDIYDLWWIYKDMSNMYLRSKDTSNAYKSYVLFKKYSDIYISKGNLDGLADAKLRYEVETHNKEVELLSLRLQNNRMLNYGLAGLIILASAIGFLIYRGSRLKNKRQISEMNRKISEITQANLRQQMNPHFIFNTLNSIQYYMYQHDKLATNNYLTKFSSLMRKVLDNSQHTSVPISDELNALNLYLELESIRFKDKFEYKINIDEEIDQLMHKVPTMLIQPYVENSICHGLIPLEGKGYVNIDLKLKDDYILCTIEDNGIGRDAARERDRKREGNHNSLGTRITASRLDLVNGLYGTSLNIVYTDLKNEEGVPSGTRVEIHIPLII